MSTAALFVSAWIGLTAIGAGGSQAPAQAPPARRAKRAQRPPGEVIEPVIRRERPSFERSDEPHVWHYRACGIMALRSKSWRYTGTLRLLLPSGRFPNVSRLTKKSQVGSPVFGLMRLSNEGRRGLPPLHHWVQPLVDAMPEKLRPPQDVIYELDWMPFRVMPVPLRDESGKGTMGMEVVVKVRGPTPEDVQALVIRVVKILDRGYCYVNQQECLRLKGRLEKRLAEVRARLGQQGENRKRLEARISRLEGYLDECEAARKANMPFPVREKVVIQPIQWEVRDE